MSRTRCFRVTVGSSAPALGIFRPGYGVGLEIEHVCCGVLGFVKGSVSQTEASM